MKKSVIASMDAFVSEIVSKPASARKGGKTKNLLPISKKAYEGFVVRIYEVFDADVPGAEAMADVLDRYILGDADAARGLSGGQLMAWAFLRQDVDVAIERSRRARARAGLRRLKQSGTMVCSEADSPRQSAHVAAADTTSVAGTDITPAAAPMDAPVAAPSGASEPTSDAVEETASDTASDAVTSEETAPVRPHISRSMRRAISRGLAGRGCGRIVNGHLKRG